MQDLTNGHEGKLIFRFAAPMLIGNIFQQLFNVVDSVVVGNFIGKEALAAVGASFPIIFMLISLIIGLVMGITVVISQYFGAKDYVRVKRAIDTMYIYTFFAGIIATTAGLLLTVPLLRLLDTPQEIMPQATQYMRIFFSGMVIFFGYNGTSAVLRGLGDSKTPLYFLIIATVANIIFDLLFVGVFSWGIKGAAFASLLANSIAFGLAIIRLNKTHKIIQIAVRGLHFDKEIFLQSIRIGLPTGIQHTLVAIGNLALLSIVNKFGTNVLAAYSVANRIDMMATIPSLSFSQALSTFVGQNIGANKTERVRTGLKTTIKKAGAITVITTVIIVLMGNIMMRMFTSDTDVIRIGNEYLTIVSAFYLLFTMMFIFNGIMRGAGDTIFPMFFSLVSLWLVRIPLAYYLSARMGESGIWWAIPAGWLIGLILSFFYYRTGRWKASTVVKYFDNM